MSRPHRPRQIKVKGTAGYPWPVCQGCGLVYLKNAATERAVRAPCDDKGKLSAEAEAAFKAAGMG